MYSETRKNDGGYREDYESADQAGCGDSHGAIELPQKDQKPSEEQRRGDLEKNGQDSDDLLDTPLLQTVQPQLTKACNLA